MADLVELTNPVVRRKLLLLAERILSNPKRVRGGRRIISVSVGPKEKRGVVGDVHVLALVFLVNRKGSVDQGDGVILDGQPKPMAALFGALEDPDFAGRLVETDVQEIGDVTKLMPTPVAHLPTVSTAAAIFHTTYGSLRQIITPTPPGASVGHALLPGAGTLGMYVRDSRSQTLYALSNNHVLALEAGVRDRDPATGVGQAVGAGPAGHPLGVLDDPVNQPGDEGPLVATRLLATLAGFAPIEYVGAAFDNPPINYADVAVAAVHDAVADARFPYQTAHGEPDFVRTLTSAIREGDMVRKVGKASGLTFGRVLHVGVPVRIDYTADAAVFRNQCIATHMSVNGDSGSVVMAAASPELYGLVFAGSNDVTIFSPLKQVLQVLERYVLMVPDGTLVPA